MDASPTPSVTTACGTLTTEKSRRQFLLSPRKRCPTVDVIRTRYIWKPSREAFHQIYRGFKMALDCYQGHDGLRRFLPTQGVEDFIARAWMGGLAVLCQVRKMDAHQQQSYRAQWFLFQRARGMKEHLDRAFNWARDLYVRHSGREEPWEKDVLPASLGINADGQGQRWDVQELKEQGLRFAKAAGYAHVGAEQVIHFGLVCAARQAPLCLPDEDVPDLVRRALFDLGPGDIEPDEALTEIVAERVLEALHQHAGAEQGASQFNAWFSGPHNSFVTQIAKQRRARGGRLDRNDVRRSLLWLGWQAYACVGDCIHAQMRAIENALPDLTDAERNLFKHMHLRQSYFGGLPLVMLAERMGFLRTAVLDIWDNRSHGVQVLYRLLQFYAIMAATRREADRRFKPVTSRKNRGGEPVKFFPLAENRDARLVADALLSRDLAEHLREVRGLACRCRATPCEFKFVRDSQGQLRVEYCCPQCDSYTETEVSREELIRLADSWNG